MPDVVMHGTGNRFLLHFGVGDPQKLLAHCQDVDGVLILTQDKETDLNMQIFNVDGGEAQQCGNGLRCAALHAYRSELVPRTSMTIRTRAGVNHCVVHPERNEVEVLMGYPKVGGDTCGVALDVQAEFPPLQFVNLGNPNAVLWTEEDPLSVREVFGELITNHVGFSEGMNLHVARRDAQNCATIASWERGVGPTLASGTGGASVFVTCTETEPFVVTSVGGSLTYSYTNEGQIRMAGPAVYA
jgi:diaminopimelate epimerase